MRSGTVRIGLTGPIGCGKSTVAGWLRDLGAAVIDADVVAREVVAPGTPALDAVLRAFGPEVRRPDGNLDRARLGRIVFSDPEALARLEAIVHPAVRPRVLEGMEQAAADGEPAVVVEAIKLVEGGLAALCDEVWLVVCAPPEQATRLAGRGLPAGEASQRIEAQGDFRSRIEAVATRVIDTSGSLADARASVERAWLAAIGAPQGRSAATD